MTQQDLTRRFVSELIRAANEVGTLTKLERARLFQRASATVLGLREMREVEIANDLGTRDMAYQLSEYGRLSDGMSDEAISAWLLDAAEAIKTELRP